MILNQASNIMLGNQEVQRVYLGKTLVWERKCNQYDPQKIAVILLDSQNNLTSTISYFEQYDNARNFIKNNTTNHYALYVGKEFAETNNMASSTFSSLTNLISVYFSGSGASLFASNGHQFENCINLETVTIEGNSSILPQYCFNGCTSLKEIYIPDSVQELGAGCFQNCNDLHDFPFPENLSEIGSICFKASGLTTLNLNYENIHISSGAFQNCQNLCTANVGHVVNGNNTPSSLFQGCSHLSSVVFSGDALWGNTFRGCTELYELILKNVVTIETNNFLDCSNLEEIYFPDSVASIKNYQFSKNSGIRYIYIGNGISEIASYAFQNTPYLQEIHLEKSEGTVSGEPWGADRKTIAVTYEKE